MMKTTTASAPGKLMLFGEHGVVYDRPCIVTTVGRRVQASVSNSNNAILSISTPRLRERHTSYQVALSQAGQALQPETSFVEAVATRLRDRLGLQDGLHIRTDGPALSYGLGSSSAVTVATALALCHHTGQQLSPEELFDICYTSVLDAQGKGSGFDVAAAIYGGTILYQMPGRVTRLKHEPIPLLIGYSGAKVSTRRFVDGVEGLRERHPGLLDGIFDLIAELVGEAQIALTQADWVRLGELADINQGLLDAMGVSTATLARLIEAARDEGAFGAKLSGAGGGDCMFAIIAEANSSGLVEAYNRLGQYVDLPIGVEGVRIEQGA